MRPDVRSRDNGDLLNEQMRESMSVNQAAFNEARLMVVDKSFNLNSDGVHWF